MIATQLPAIQVALPLLAAPLVLILRNGALAWSVAVAVSWLSFAVALALLLRVLDGGTIVYLLGDWAAPWGIEYRIDEVNAFVLVIVTSVAAVVAPYARRSVEAEVSSDRHYLFYTGFLLCLCGLLGIAITGDVFNLFVFLEISSLSSYLLIGLSRDRRALTAAFRYLILGTVGATFYVIGIGLMYMMTGSLNMADLATRLPAVADTTTIHAALAFLTIGLALKAAIFPLHLWLPNAYAHAPSVVTAFLAATATKVSIYVFLRIFLTVFGGASIFESFPLADLLIVVAVLGMFTGSLVAIYQSDVKRALAFSSVAQIGYMILGISLLSTAGVAAGIVHLFNHALMKCALFLALGAVALRIGSARLDQMAGIGREMPWTMAAFTVAGLSLIGVPATVGFVSKWALVMATLEKDHVLLAVLILFSSLLAVIYVWRVVEVAYFRDRPDGAATLSDPPTSMLVPLWIMTGAAVYFGLDGTRVLDVATAAATRLLEGRP